MDEKAILCLMAAQLADQVQDGVDRAIKIRNRIVGKLNSNEPPFETLRRDKQNLTVKQTLDILSTVINGLIRNDHEDEITGHIYNICGNKDVVFHVETLIRSFRNNNRYEQ